MFTPSLFPDDLDHVLAHSRDDWEELRGQRLFMTGGTGFFGIWLIETFLWANEKLELGAELACPLARSGRPCCEKCPIWPVNPSLGSMPAIWRASTSPPASSATSSTPPPKTTTSPAAAGLLAAFDQDIAGTRRVLDFARQCGAKRVLFTSSGAVYGRQPSELTHIPEDYLGSFAPTDTRSGYGQAKRVSEFL